MMKITRWHDAKPKNWKIRTTIWLAAGLALCLGIAFFVILLVAVSVTGTGKTSGFVVFLGMTSMTIAPVFFLTLLGHTGLAFTKRWRH